MNQMLRNVSVRLSPDELKALEALAVHYHGRDVGKMSLGEAGRRAILAEARRLDRRTRIHRANRAGEAKR